MMIHPPWNDGSWNGFYLDDDVDNSVNVDDSDIDINEIQMESLGEPESVWSILTGIIVITAIAVLMVLALGVLVQLVFG